MRTSQQIAAARANGTLSKGPVSIQGKLDSSCNSLRPKLWLPLAGNGSDAHLFLRNEPNNLFIPLTRSGPGRAPHPSSALALKPRQ